MPNKLAGQRIREMREVQSYAREALAEKTGISDKFLYEVETFDWDKTVHIRSMLHHLCYCNILVRHPDLDVICRQ